MANAIPKGHYECEICKNPWLVAKSKRYVFSADKTKIIRTETEYVCDVCGNKAFTIDEKSEN
jgi:Zn finger protein HypA/HybF involved in hydrogenase expression